MSKAIQELTKAIQDLTKILSQQDSKPKLEDVRAALAEIAKQGKTQEMKTLLSKYGATKLSEVKSEDYPSLLTAAEELKNA